VQCPCRAAASICELVRGAYNFAVHIELQLIARHCRCARTGRQRTCCCTQLMWRWPMLRMLERRTAPARR
jgi:hypothetical protein